MGLAGKAVAALAAIAERLNPGERDADGIGVMAMRRKGLTMQMGFETFDAVGARRDPNAVAGRPARRARAQAFKTAPVMAPYRAGLFTCRPGKSMTNQAALQPLIWQPMLTLILASAVIMGSPGPSPLSAMAVGAAFGFRRSLTYVGGLILGTTAVLFAVAIGVVTLLLSIPHGAAALLALSSIYILYLSFRIATAPPLAVPAARVAAPAFGGGFLLAIANPKAYLAIAAVFAGTEIFADNQALDVTIKLVLLGVMIVIIHLCWLLAGASLSRILRSPTASRIVNLSLATALIVTTATALLR